MLQHLLEASLRNTTSWLVRPMLNPAVPIGLQRTLTAQAYRSSMPPRGCRFEQDSLAGIAAIRSGFGETPEQALLYLHGGGYVIGSASTHRGLTGHLAKASGCEVFTPDYRLAPEHPFPAALDDAEAAWMALIERGFRPEQMAVAGDSAGGGLSVALAMRLRDKGLPLPSSITVFSPWVDLTHSQVYSPEREPVLQLRWTEKCAALYAGTEALDNPLLSPVFGDLRGLPPILIQVGSDEILLNDSERLATTARRDGVSTSLEIYNGLWHVFQIHSGQLARATEAVTTAGNHIRGHLAG